VTEDRALDIIAGYGADAARWPADERAALTAAIAASPVLQRALADARATDAAIAGMIGDWAQVAPSAADSARLAAAARASAPRWNRWLGGAFAAALAASLIAIAPMPRLWGDAPEQQGTTSPTIVASADDTGITDAQAYAMLFTLTPQEESLI
jgi:anti-sigma factor RsiW